MAGGTGTRLWPVSRKDRPKQTHTFFGEGTLFQNSVKRILPIFDIQRIFIVTNRDLLPTLMEQVPDLPVTNFIVEPEGKGTAPCIGLASIHILNKDPNAIMIVLTADHYIRDVEKFRVVIKGATKIAHNGHIVTLGMLPSYPSTGYGYIKQAGKLCDVDGFSVYHVDKFVEKPDMDTAVKMLDGSYFWNSGMFIWRVDRILDEFQRHMPILYSQLLQISEGIEKSEYEYILTKTWSEVDIESIDYGIMEKATDVVVIPLDIGWSDIGSWSSLATLLNEDEAGNVVIGNNLSLDTSGSFIFGDKRFIATIGLRDIIIVDTDDALLVCTKKTDQKVRDIINIIRENKLLHLV